MTKKEREELETLAMSEAHLLCKIEKLDKILQEIYVDLGKALQLIEKEKLVFTKKRAKK